VFGPPAVAFTEKINVGQHVAKMQLELSR
jgi:hypothetical protein